MGTAEKWRNISKPCGRAIRSQHRTCYRWNRPEEAQAKLDEAAKL